MKTLYRYHQERRFALPPEAIWPLIADTARINELAGTPQYEVEERPDGQGRVHRFATAAVGPLRIKWEESYGEWQENRRLVQNRRFLNAPIGRFQAGAEIYRDGTGSRLVFFSEIECLGILGWLIKLSGQFDREANKRLATVERMIGDVEAADRLPGASPDEVARPAARRRLATLVAELERQPAVPASPRSLPIICCMRRA